MLSLNLKALFDRNGRALLGALVLAFLVVLVFGEFSWPRRFIPQEKVWRVVEREAGTHGLNPKFVMAIVEAESSFNANASNGNARGIMQITPGAWRTVSNRSFGKAWNWEANIVAGTAYLARLKKFLETYGSFSYPHLAASYLHGINRVKRIGGRLYDLPPTRNRIYQKLHGGRLPIR